MRRLSVLPVALTAAALAYTNSSAAAAPEAPLAPINTSLLQGNPAAPTSIDDVLLVPSASAGQKGAAFEWADKSHTQAYVLWDKFFAAAQYTPVTRNDSAAQTIASFGYMSPGFGVGVSLAYRDHLTEDVDANKTITAQEFSQAKVFASVGTSALDLYGSLVWADPKANVYADYDNKYLNRADSLALQVGVRHAPVAGAEGFAWNANVTPAVKYVRDAGSKGEYIWLFAANAQIGYVFQVDGIQFLPGVDGFLDYENGKGYTVNVINDSLFGLTGDSPDYAGVIGLAPSLAISVPLFEHWTLAGGAKYSVYQTLVDRLAGSPSHFDDDALISNATGSLGLRYARDRWAAEAQIANAFLSNGPQFISGTTTSGLMASFGFTVNLK